MPKILERLVGQLEAKGKDKGSAFAIATSQLQKHGVLKKGTQELTPKGAERQAMGAEGRAKDRAAQGSSHSPSDFTYSNKTNRATLAEDKMPKAKRYQDGGLSSDPQAGQLSAGYWDRVRKETEDKAALKEALDRQKRAGGEILKQPPVPPIDARARPMPVPSPARPAPPPTAEFQARGGISRSAGSFAQGGPPLGRSGGETAKNVQRMLRSSGYDDTTPVTIGPSRRR